MHCKVISKPVLPNQLREGISKPLFRTSWSVDSETNFEPKELSTSALQKYKNIRAGRI